MVWISEQITLQAEMLTKAVEELEHSNERLVRGLASVVEQYEDFTEGYLGGSAAAYNNAMMTFYGKCAKVSGIHNGCRDVLNAFSTEVQAIDEDAGIKAKGGSGRWDAGAERSGTITRR